MNNRLKYGIKTWILIMLITSMCFWIGCGNNSKPASGNATDVTVENKETEAAVSDADSEDAVEPETEEPEETVADQNEEDNTEESAEESIDTTWYTNNNKGDRKMLHETNIWL